MDRPKVQPSKDLLAIFAIGPISSMTYNKDATDGSEAEAEDRARGCSFEYEVIIDLKGKRGNCTIGEYAFKHVELCLDRNSYGCWGLKLESIKLCEDWLKWIKSEEKELTTFRRLQKKFAYLD